LHLADPRTIATFPPPRAPVRSGDTAGRKRPQSAGEVARIWPRLARFLLHFHRFSHRRTGASTVDEQAAEADSSGGPRDRISSKSLADGIATPQRPATFQPKERGERCALLECRVRRCNVPLRGSRIARIQGQCFSVVPVSIWQLGFIRPCARMLSLSSSQRSVCLTL